VLRKPNLHSLERYKHSEEIEPGYRTSILTTESETARFEDLEWHGVAKADRGSPRSDFIFESRPCDGLVVMPPLEMQQMLIKRYPRSTYARRVNASQTLKSAPTETPASRP
jgi:hypothetical protein